MALMVSRDRQVDDAVAAFDRAHVPATERRVVETVRLLAPLERRARGGEKIPPAQLEPIQVGSAEHDRSSIIVARAARELGYPEIATCAYKAALACIDDNSSLASRIMVALHAADYGTASDVIDLLDTRLPLDGFDREHTLLARAHAMERPLRARNLL